MFDWSLFFMKTKKKKISSSTIILLIITLFIVATTATMGTVLTIQSVNSMKQMVENKTVEMAMTAAALLDADSLKGMEATDVDTPAYQNAYDILKAFRISNAGASGELAFIYLCREEAPDTFVFTIDPSEDPAAFGEALDWTPALDSASKGIAAFDKDPFTDRWGTFYSAYAPVLDDNNNVVMIVGVDVWAYWYKDSIWNNSKSIITVSVIATAAGIFAGILITLRLRKKLDNLSSDFNNLQGDVKTLISEIKEPMELNESNEEVVGSKDKFVQLREQIHDTQKEIKEYIVYTKKQAYMDALSRVGNRAAYQQRCKEIVLGNKLTVMVIDINALKYINDEYGHEYGDKSISLIGSILRSIFDESDIFRYGGDEFVIILNGKEGITKDDVIKMYNSVSERLEKENNKGDLPFDLGISKGMAFFDRKVDKHYTDVFSRADEEMYKNKQEFYKKNPKLKYHR